MTEITINIEGMSCQHCVNRVKKAIEAIDGVKNLDVAIGRTKITFDEGKVSKSVIEKAITAAGYKVAA
jgi:copper chaperone